jgi:hypothetical protein
VEFAICCGSLASCIALGQMAEHPAWTYGRWPYGRTYGRTYGRAYGRWPYVRWPYGRFLYTTFNCAGQSHFAWSEFEPCAILQKTSSGNPRQDLDVTDLQALELHSQQKHAKKKKQKQKQAEKSVCNNYI